MPNGTVKWFNSKKGFGFITPADSEQDIFVHYSAIITEENEFRSLYENDEVAFELNESPKGLEAKDVKVLKRAPRQPRRNKSHYDNKDE